MREILKTSTVTLCGVKVEYYQLQDGEHVIRCDSSFVRWLSCAGSGFNVNPLYKFLDDNILPRSFVENVIEIERDNDIILAYGIEQIVDFCVTVVENKDASSSLCSVVDGEVCYSGMVYDCINLLSDLGVVIKYGDVFRRYERRS